MDIDEETADEYYEEARNIRRSLQAAREQAAEEQDEARSYYLTQIHYDYHRA